MRDHDGKREDHGKSDMIRKWKLIEYLDLTEDQSDRFFARMNTFDKKMKASKERDKELRKQINNLLDDEDMSQRSVNKLMGEYFDIQEKRLALRRAHHQGIGDILSPRQTAKYAIFDHQFKKRMKDQLRDRDRKPRRRRD